MESWVTEITALIHLGCSYNEVSQFLRQFLPVNTPGLSPRSVRRFCVSRGIRFCDSIDHMTLVRLINCCVTLLGHSYGRRTMQGFLRSEGINASQRRIGNALRVLYPHAHHQRAAVSYQHINPLPYRASHFGEKLHFDQNEKLNMLGIIHVLAIDGFSRNIVGLISIPKKNPIIIFDRLFRPILEQYGIWDQLRMDHGTEFNLVISVQYSIAQFRANCHPHCVLQSTFRQNHRAERIWPEVNSRINYPVKRILIQLESDNRINMSDEVHKFCESWVTLKVIATPVQRFVNSWNAHTIPGNRGGIPNNLVASYYQVGQISRANIPTTDSAIQQYQHVGGHLTHQTPLFGTDPLVDYPHLQELGERDYMQLYSCLDDIFHDIQHGRGVLLEEAILFFIDLNLKFLRD